MNLIHIPPTKGIVPTLTMQGMHLILAHVALEDDIYRKTYAACFHGPSYVILDNGIYEGAQLDAKALLELADEIRPAEIVAPDIIGAGRESRDMTLAFVKQVRRHYAFQNIDPPKVMGVPHGKNVTEWFTNAKALVDGGVDVIGLYLRMHEIGINRLGCLEALGRLPWARNVPVHLLGVRDALELKTVVTHYPYVRGMDTAKFFRMWMHGVPSSQALTAKISKRDPNYFNATLPSGPTISRWGSWATHLHQQLWESDDAEKVVGWMPPTAPPTK